MKINLFRHLLFFLLLFNVIVAYNHLEKRDIHRIIIQEETRRPKRHHGHKHHHRHVKHEKHRKPRKHHSFEDFSGSLESYENISENDKSYGVCYC